jgi:hypothetical protein
MNRVRWFCLATVVLSGCSNSAEWIKKLDQILLYKQTTEVRFSGGCRVPREYGQTFPIPATPTSFVVEYYPVGMQFPPTKPWSVFEPVAIQRFSADGKAEPCQTIANLEEVKPLGTFLPSEEWDSAKEEFQFWSGLEKFSKLYQSHAHLTGGDTDSASDFVKLFQKRAEPGFLPIYYHANPDFWEWLRQEAGVSIPKP